MTGYYINKKNILLAILIKNLLINPKEDPWIKNIPNL